MLKPILFLMFGLTAVLSQATDLPASSSAKRHQRKMESFDLQQEKKRFLSACMEFENRPVSEWKKASKNVTEFKKFEGKLLEGEWRRLKDVVDEAINTRSIASTEVPAAQLQSLQKLRELREKFLLNSKDL